jgi:thiosulfate reductase cytochrome b subunit
VFFLLFIVRTGWTLHRGGRPAMFWTRRNTGLIRTRNPPMRMSLTLWLHLSFDALWVLNGAVFYVLIFATGQWVRIVPTRWDTVPNALSAALQYASLDWPSENGWVNYNALQLVSYFLVVFVAAPLAILTGLRLSPAWPRRKKRLDAVFPFKTARRVHYWVLIFFIAFTIVHVTLVLATGALNNLNHMYAVRNDDSWVGFWVFAASIVVMAAAWVGARPSVLRSIAAVGGRVSP